MQKHFNKKNLIYAGVALGAAITAGSLLYNICKRARKRVFHNYLYSLIFIHIFIENQSTQISKEEAS